MVQSLKDFEESTVFERSVLAAVLPIVDFKSTGAILDLSSGDNGTLILPGVVFGTEASSSFVQTLRPLFFASAWKILDQLIEYGLKKHSKLNPRITWKGGNARTANVPPLSKDNQIWERISSLYINTIEIRHCLVHRRFIVDANGNMTNLVDIHGAPLPNVMAEEQVEFCRVIQRSASIALKQGMTARDRLDLVASLDVLGGLHDLELIGDGVHARKPNMVRVNATYISSSWRVDTVTALSRADQSMPGQPYYDIEVNFPGTQIPPIRGHLEEAPQDQNLLIDPSNPSPWMDP